MRNHFRLAAAAAICMLMLWAAAVAENVYVVNPSSEPMTQEKMNQMVEAARIAFYQDQELKDELASEIQARYEIIPTEEYPEEEREFYVLSHRGAEMRFFMEIIGAPEENGRYPLYITLHGGGGAPEEENNDQWIDMFSYYKGAVENGIYIACRGISDTWDLHFQQDSYPLYDHLIEAMIVNYRADPDRVYLLGFSAGGDGVYQIAPRLADRFAAANMSSGHPNGVSLLNLANCPIILQAGIRDYYSENVMRSVRAAEFEKILSGYREKYGDGYDHEVFIHVPAGHNYIDYEDYEDTVLKNPTDFADRAEEDDILEVFLDVMEKCGLYSDVSELSYLSLGQNKEFDSLLTETVTQNLGLETIQTNTNAIRLVSQYTRNPAPTQVIWDLSTRAKKQEKNSFYWLKADSSVDSGIIIASYDAESNTITVEPDENVNGDFYILFHPSLVDITRPVIVQTGDITCSLQVNPSEEYFKASMYENGDPELACIGEIPYSLIVSSH